MKYTDEWGKVRTLLTEKHPLKEGRELLHWLLYQASLKLTKNPTPENHDSVNKADTRPVPEEECLWEINPLVTSVDKLDFNNTANFESEWFINENFDLSYFSALASDSIQSNTSTDINNDSLSIIDALASLHAPVRSSLMVHEKTNDA